MSHRTNRSLFQLSKHSSIVDGASESQVYYLLTAAGLETDRGRLGPNESHWDLSSQPVGNCPTLGER